MVLPLGKGQLAGAGSETATAVALGVKVVRAGGLGVEGTVAVDRKAGVDFNVQLMSFRVFQQALGQGLPGQELVVEVKQ